jgi:hypothetical protein
VLTPLNFLFKFGLFFGYLIWIFLVKMGAIIPPLMTTTTFGYYPGIPALRASKAVAVLSTLTSPVITS